MATTSKHPNLASALIAAQKAFKPIHKDNRANTGKYSYTYADLGSVLEAVTPALHDNGLVIIQAMDYREGHPCIVTQLIHADSDDSSVWSYTPIIWADQTDPQKFGGGITYARRYALMAMLNLNAEDDDAHQARQPAKERPASNVVAPPSAAVPDVVVRDGIFVERRQDAPVQDTEPISDKAFDEKVRRWVETKDPQVRMELVDDARDLVSRWVTLVQNCESTIALDWVAAKFEKYGGGPNALVARTIEKRRQELADPNYGAIG
jgi:hypothetical protein